MRKAFWYYLLRRVYAAYMQMSRRPPYFHLSLITFYNMFSVNKEFDLNEAKLFFLRLTFSCVHTPIVHMFEMFNF